MCVSSQEWCALEACCTAIVCHLADDPVVLCQALRRVILTNVLRAVAVQSAATTMMCASVVYNCKIFTSCIILTMVINCHLADTYTHTKHSH